jgi:hypothetical protein
MLQDPAVIAAIADFGAVVAGVVVERGGRLASDFCVLARIEPGRKIALSYPDDEDELEELEPDYVGWVSYALCKTLLEETMAGRRPDPLRAILEGKVRLKGDLERLVKHAGRHRGAGLDAIRSVPAEFV